MPRIKKIYVNLIQISSEVCSFMQNMINSSLFPLMQLVHASQLNIILRGVGDVVYFNQLLGAAGTQ